MITSNWRLCTSRKMTAFLKVVEWKRVLPLMVELERGGLTYASYGVWMVDGF